MVIGSAVLHELGLINEDLDDIDITILKPEIWERFTSTYKTCDVTFGKAVRIGRAFPNPWIVEFFGSVGPSEFNYMTKEGIVSGGINFITLENLLTYKKLLNRSKDQKHIEIIEKYLQQRRCKI